MPNYEYSCSVCKTSVVLGKLLRDHEIEGELRGGHTLGCAGAFRRVYDTFAIVVK